MNEITSIYQLTWNINWNVSIICFNHPQRVPVFGKCKQYKILTDEKKMKRWKRNKQKTVLVASARLSWLLLRLPIDVEINMPLFGFERWVSHLLVRSLFTVRVATRKLKSAETCLHLQRPTPSSGTRVVLDSNPRASGTRPDVFEYSGTLSRVHAARAYSRFLKAVSIRST